MAVTAALLGAGYWAIVAQQATLVWSQPAYCLLLSADGAPDCLIAPPPSGGSSVSGAVCLGTQVLGYATNNVDNVALGAFGCWAAGCLQSRISASDSADNQINDPMTRIVLPILSRVQEDPENVSAVRGEGAVDRHL